MTSAQELGTSRFRQVVTTKVSYWQVFRVIFVLFSLYLLGDVFYRWDGFRYYASFSEFMPAVALITVLWTAVAVFTALLVWLPVKLLKWFCLQMGWEVEKEHLLLFTYTFLLSGVMIWIVKRFILPGVQTTILMKLVVFLCVTAAVTFLSWLFRNKAEKWIGTIQERITPLVWLFGILVILSVPLVAYNTRWKQTDIIVPESITQSLITDKNLPNIILVTFDALTVRDMSVYGYHRPTTPFITKWAKDASLFTMAEAESDITTSTTASLMTGKRVWTHQTFHSESSNPVRGSIESLPLLLKNNGYYNMAFIVNWRASVQALGMSNSFDIAPQASEFRVAASLRGFISVTLLRLFGDKIRLHNWFVKNDFVFGWFLKRLLEDVTTVPPEKAFNKFLEVLDNNPPEPFFVWIHLFPPHMPYLPPKPYKGMFESSLRQKSLKGPSWPDIRRARYDEFVRYCDKQFEDLITQLTIMNRLKNTVIILSSDHGESFEHDFIGHGTRHLYEQVTLIPLIIKEPNQAEGRIIDDLVEQIDIPPTILELANIPVPFWMEGRSLVPLMRGKRLLSKPAFSMNFERNPGRGHQITKGAIAVWEGDYKLIHYLEENKSLLFNLKEDPGELKNLFDKEPEIGQHLLNLIKDGLKKANERISEGE